MTIAQASIVYQQHLEAVRARPDDPHLVEDLAKARRELEIAWLNRSML